MKKIRKNNSQKQKRSYKNCRNLLSAPDERMAFGKNIASSTSRKSPYRSRRIPADVVLGYDQQ